MSDRMIGSADPRAIAAVIGALGLRERYGERSCELREDGSVIWRLPGDLIVEMRIDDDVAYWHLAIQEVERTIRLQPFAEAPQSASSSRTERP